jgi:hypothetical protein
MKPNYLDHALQVLYTCLAVIGFGSWLLGFFFSSPRPEIPLGMGYLALTLEMLRQRRKVQAFLVVASAFLVAFIWVDFTIWPVPSWIAMPFWWAGLVLTTLSYLVGWRFAEFCQSVDRDPEKEFELDSGQQIAH